MAKFYGTSIKTGRVGGSVFAVTRGVTIEKQYQPIVHNPNTPGQIAQRAKMKLVSQLSAELGDELAPFGRDGLVSPRNLFVRDVFSRNAVGYSSGQATMDPMAIRLTNSRLNLIQSFSAGRSASTNVAINVQIRTQLVSEIVGVRAVILQGRHVGDDTNAVTVVAAQTFVPNETGLVSAQLSGIDGTTGAVVYVYAFMTSSSEAVTRYGDLVAQLNDVALSLDTVRREYASSLVYGETEVAALPISE